MPRKDCPAAYKAKRDFTKTSEPKDLVAKSSGRRYLIQKHAASHLHDDFWLELDATLKSWAVPEGSSLDAMTSGLATQLACASHRTISHKQELRRMMSHL